MRARRLAICMAALLLGGAAPARYDHPFQNPDLPAATRVANLISLMTVDEKIDALSTNSGVPRLGVPSFGSTEGIHGLQQRGSPERGWLGSKTTQFPQPPGMGETWDPALVREAGGVEGYEARWITQSGDGKHPVLMAWGPQADLARDPRWGRSEEVYSEDPFLAGTMATAFARGLEGADPKYWQAAPLLKHFLANSNENDRTRTSSDFDERLFWEYYSKPFRMAFQDAGASAVMASYNAWNGIPMAVNPVLRSVVIDRWHVGIVSSDGGAIKTLVKDHKTSPDQQAAAVAALKAGINQYLDLYKDELHAALKAGQISEADLDEALRRKFPTTIKLGLLDPLERVAYTRIRGGTPPWDGAKHQAIAKRMALESIVLLKNDAHALPIAKASLRSVAVIGPLADGVHWDWYGGFPPHATTPLDGIKAAVGEGVKVNFAHDDTNGAAVAAAKASDVAIVVVGNDPTCGPNMAHDWTDNGTKPCADPGDGREGRDRETINLAQEELVRKVLAANPRTVMVLVSSFPFAINWSQAHVPAILHMTHASQDEGSALADVIFGAYNPGGHTVATWPASMDQLPPMMDYDIRHGRTYMYFKGKPLYPFGYGLSYTSFRYANLSVDRSVLAKNGVATVSVDVTNTGRQSGDAVPQLYVHHLASKVSRPTQQLAGFQRVHLQPGQTRTVKIPLKAAELAYWNGKALTVEAEPLELRIGDNAADILLRQRLVVR